MPTEETVDNRLHVEHGLRIMVRRYPDGNIKFVGPGRHVRQLKSLIKKYDFEPDEEGRAPTSAEYWFYRKKA